MVKFKFRKFNKYKKDFYDNLIGSFTKKGLKTKIKKYVNKAFQIVHKQTGCTFSYILIRLINILKTPIEVRQAYIKKKLIFIPFLISYKRQFFLAIKWFIKSVKENKSKLSFVNKLVIELLTIVDLKGFKTSKAVNYKKLNNRLAFNNRSNIHYRW